MNKNPMNKGVVMENGVGIGTVSRGMVRQRAIELALINGRSESEVSPADWEQAKRELTGGADIDQKSDLLESLPESERWDPIHGSTGHQVPTAAAEDQDDEGRSESAQLFEQGVNEAEQDQMLQAVRSQRREDD